MKKLTCILALLLALTVALCACAGKTESTSNGGTPVQTPGNETTGSDLDATNGGTLMPGSEGAEPDSCESGGIIYELSEDGTYAIVAGYDGAATDIEIAAQYEGCPVRQIEDLAFYGNIITSVIIPDSVTTIGDYAFESCVSLTGIEIPDSVTTIGVFAFAHCFSLTSVELPGSITAIGDYAFSDCSSLTAIEIPDSVISIGIFAFAYCSALTDIEIPDSVTTIGKSAFADCSGLTGIELPDSVTTIGEKAFYYCSDLTEVTMGCGVTAIGDKAFSACASLTDIYYQGTEEQWQAVRKSGASIPENCTIHYK